MTHPRFIYKISPKSAWDEATQQGVFEGAPIDLADGYIHFSTAEQLSETAAKHFSGKSDLILAAIDSSALGDALRYEVSRNGELFPHLYEPLDMNSVAWVKPMPLDESGIPQMPKLED